MPLKYTTITQPVPLGGLNTRDEPTLMSRLMSPDMQNIEIDRSFVKKRLGYITLGTNLPLDGTGMELIQYTDGQGVQHNIALTTTDAYLYDSGADDWDKITPSLLIEDCEDVWAGGSGDTIVKDAVDFKVGSASAKVTLVADRGTNDQLMAKDISSTSYASNTNIGFWIKSETAISAKILEIVVSEDNIATGLISGVEGTDFVICKVDVPLVAGVWTFFSVAKDLTNLDAVVAVGLYAAKHVDSGTVIRVDDIKASTSFTGDDDDRWSHTVATNPTDFTNNGGTALIISNGVDEPFYFEGQTGDEFQALTVSSELTNFQFTNEVADFWNHLFLLNYRASSPAVDYVRNAAFHDVSSDGAYVDLGITEVVLTDSIGKLRRAKKLGYDMVLYSDSSITICRRVGGTSLFIFPTVIYETGLFAEKGVWDFVNQHFFLGTDQKIYVYQGGTQLVPIGLLIEESLFLDLDPSKTPYIVTGHDPVKHKLYWFYPKTSDTYASSYYAYSYDKSPQTWEKGRFADTVADMSVFNNQATWAFDGPQVAGTTFDDPQWATTPFNDGATVGGYPQTIFLSREGNVFRFTTGSATDDGSDIEAWFTTPDLVPIEGRTDEYARFSNFGFSGKSLIADSTILVSFSTDEGENWTDLDTITLTDEWIQYRVPCDIKTQKIRFRIYQNSAKDFQIRSLSYKVQLNTDR